MGVVSCINGRLYCNLLSWPVILRHPRSFMFPNPYRKTQWGIDHVVGVAVAIQLLGYHRCRLCLVYKSFLEGCERCMVEAFSLCFRDFNVPFVSPVSPESNHSTTDHRAEPCFLLDTVRLDPTRRPSGASAAASTTAGEA